MVIVLLKIKEVDKLKWYIIILIIIFSTLTIVSAENVTVQNTHNSDINDSKYINPNDYYFDENKTRIPYTSDTGSFNNVSMSNGYNAYAIQDGGYIKTNDSKSHPSFWNDTYYVVDANDSETVVGHWYYADKQPIGEYLKILFFNHYDDLLNLNKNNPNVPSSIFVQSYIWDLYKNGGNTEKLTYKLNRESVYLYNEGYRINNTGNIQWINESAYRIFNFLAFKNLNPFNKDLWGFKVELFNKSADTENDGVGNITENKLVNNSTDNNSIKSYTRDTNLTVNNTQPHFNIKSKISNHNVEKSFSDIIKLDKETGNSIYLLFFIFIIIIGVYFKKRF